MFKFYGNANREGSDRGEPGVIGHDRFCQHRNFGLPRYRRRKPQFSHRKTQAFDQDLGFELNPISTGSGESSMYNSTSAIGPSGSGTASTKVDLQGTKLAELQAMPFHASTSSNPQNNQTPSRGYLTYTTTTDERPGPSGWVSISRFFTSMAATLTCRQPRNKASSLKYTPSIIDHNGPSHAYKRLGDEVMSSSTVMELRNTFIDLSPGVIHLEKAAGHRICKHYLESMKGRYMLIDHLPDIGWRTNRLWYLICDSRVRAERLLTITPCNPKTQCVNSNSTNAIIQVCEGLQHPYICPVLDLEIINSTYFGKQFMIAVAPVIVRGSLRDLYHRSQWTDSWHTKYNIGRGGNGVTEIQAQRLSCHILEALLKLRNKGLPPGIGAHLHSGNVLVQNGTARFSGLDNILFGQQPRQLPFVTRNKGNPEAIDSISFAFILFSMCTGYEITGPNLTPQNWSDIKDCVQVCEVLEFILKNPDNRYPTLHEISQLNFYRTLDLRELSRVQTSISRPVLANVKTLLEYLESNKLRKGRKSKSSLGVCDIHKTKEVVPTRVHFKEKSSLTMSRRPCFSSTPSIAQRCSEPEAAAAAVVVNDEGQKDPVEIEPSTFVSSSSSLMSIYCTPPTSLGFSLPDSPSADELMAGEPGE